MRIHLFAWKVLGTLSHSSNNDYHINILLLLIILRLFALVCAKIRVYFSIRTYFFFLILHNHVSKKHTYQIIYFILPFIIILFLYNFFTLSLSLSLSTHTHTHGYYSNNLNLQNLHEPMLVIFGARCAKFTFYAIIY